MVLYFAMFTPGRFSIANCAVVLICTPTVRPARSSGPVMALSPRTTTCWPAAIYGSENSIVALRSGVMVTAEMTTSKLPFCSAGKTPSKLALTSSASTPQLARDRAGDVDVEAAELAAFGDAKRRIGRVDADPQPAAGAHAFERRLRRSSGSARTSAENALASTRRSIRVSFGVRRIMLLAPRARHGSSP